MKRREIKKNRKSYKKTAEKTPFKGSAQENYEKLINEINEIQKEYMKIRGQKDVDHVKRVYLVSVACEVVGRFLIHFSLDPVTWSVGVFSLFIHGQLKTAEIGHLALHGAYDGLEGAEKFYSKNYKWPTPIDEASWRRHHNILHHQFTNIIGKDPDTHYNFHRMSKDVPWRWYHLFQAAQPFAYSVIFYWFMGMFSSGFADFFHKTPPEIAKVVPEKNLKGFLDSLKTFSKKAVPYSVYNFLFWPMLAGPFYLKVLAGNVMADVMNSIYICASIYPGHYVDGLESFDKDFKTHDKGEWYIAQLKSTCNFEVPKLISILCGGLNYQIEHHLFPKMPANRLREVAPKVKEICEKYGIKYNSMSWPKAWSKVLQRLLKMSVP